MSSEAPLPFFSRVILAYVAFFKVLFDGVFARRVAALDAPTEPAPRAALPAPTEAASSEKKETTPMPNLEEVRVDGALALLSILQEQARLIDFVQEDVAGFSDADVGAAARVVHQGMRKVLAGHGKLGALREEAEGSSVTIERVDARVKLTGNVAGAAPFRGVLRHRGWKLEGLHLPTRIGDAAPEVLAPAEVEL